MLAGTPTKIRARVTPHDLRRPRVLAAQVRRNDRTLFVEPTACWPGYRTTAPIW